MTRTRSMVPLFLGLAMLFVTHRASAATCTGIEDLGSSPCTGAGGCESEHEVEMCFFGCTCGECDRHGSSGECCGHIYYVPNVYQGQGCGNCGECGGARTHIRSTSIGRGVASDTPLELRQDYSPGLIVLTRTLSYREPLFVYVLNRCDHTYRLIAEEELTRKTGGM
jgi:hypothetical protein